MQQYIAYGQKQQQKKLQKIYSTFIKLDLLLFKYW